MNNNKGSLKRSLSFSDSEDCSEDDGQTGSCAVSSGSQCYRSPARKRRRGVIEKRRRDRINNSLDELKRLVPQAFEKSGSSKLEKAEILQMTVDHLKVVQSSKSFDLNGSSKGPGGHEMQKIAIDYHALGFRECASEVAKYLISCEGLDDIRLRLMSHLQAFMAQKELSTRVSTIPQHIGAAPSVSPSHYQHNQTWTTYPGYYGDAPFANLPPQGDPLSYFTPTSQTDPPATTSIASTSAGVTSLTTLTSSCLTTPTSPSVDHWTMVNNGFASMHHASGQHPHQFSPFSPANSHNPYGKPYRPWGGAEMAC